MRFLKIMGIFTSILSLLSCGHGNKRVTQNDGINSNIPVAARITIDKLPDVLRNVQAGNTDYDFIGICSNGVDCIYFVLDAPVLSLKVNADIDSIVKVGSQIEHTIFRNNERTVYEIVP